MSDPSVPSAAGEAPGTTRVQRPARPTPDRRVAFVTSSTGLAHDPAPGHPERPERLRAVLEGAACAGLGDALLPLTARDATDAELAGVHPAAYVDAIRSFCASGGGWLDGDTAAAPASWPAALAAAGAGLTAIEALERGDAGSAFCAVRPPGHHATPRRAQGFCLLNNIAVAAATLAGRGERVLVVDYDAHHGNGTQDAFWDDPRVAYASMHQWPLYPGTGALEEVGGPAAKGLNVNVPLPPGTAGGPFRRAVDEVVVPLAERFRPTWLLISAGFDAHRRDPLTMLGLTSADHADVTAALLALVPEGRTIAFLEGGYDLDALTASTAATLGALAGAPTLYRPEEPTAGEKGDAAVDRVIALHAQLAG